MPSIIVEVTLSEFFDVIKTINKNRFTNKDVIREAGDGDKDWHSGDGKVFEKPTIEPETYRAEIHLRDDGDYVLTVYYDNGDGGYI